MRASIALFNFLLLHGGVYGAGSGRASRPGSDPNIGGSHGLSPIRRSETSPTLNKEPTVSKKNNFIFKFSISVSNAIFSFKLTSLNLYDHFLF